MILYLDTRGPENRVVLFRNAKQVAETIIEQRQLSERLDLSVRELLTERPASVKDLTGIIVHRGPGSFTGLRIGLSYANGLAFGLKIPLKGIEDEKELAQCLSKPLMGDSLPVLPIYSSEPNVTLRKPE